MASNAQNLLITVVTIHIFWALTICCTYVTALYEFTQPTLTITLQGCYLHFQMKKLHHRDGTQLSQVHTTNE